MNFKLIFNQLGSLYRWGRLCSLSVSALYHKNYNNILENHDLHVRFEWGNADDVCSLPHVFLSMSIYCL